MPKPERILVIKLSSLGDLFHAVPVVHRLKAAFECPIDWVTQPEYQDLVALHRDVDRIIPFPRRGSVKDLLAFRRSLRAEKYDLAVDLQGLAKSGLILSQARAERKLAPSNPREGAGWFAHEIPPAIATTVHARDRLCDTLRHLNVEPEPTVYPLDFPAVEPPAPGDPVVALAPKSRWVSKDWPEERYIELARRMVAHHEASVWIVGGPGDCEVGDRICEAVGAGVYSTCGKVSLPELGGLLQHVNVLVCNDSGPMHFAAAAGTPLVALFGPTDPARTGPVGEECTVLRPEAGPEGYPDHRSYKQDDAAFIAGLTVDEVEQAVVERLKKTRKKRKP